MEILKLGIEERVEQGMEVLSCKGRGPACDGRVVTPRGEYLGTSVEMCRESVGEEVGAEAMFQTVGYFASSEENFMFYSVGGTESLRCSHVSSIIRFSVQNHSSRENHYQSHY